MGVDDDRLAELNPKTRTCVVIGGRGFIGRSLVLSLLKLGKWFVRIADSAHSLHLDPSEHDSLLSHAIASGRASYHHIDVRDNSLVLKAVEGSSVAFYVDHVNLHADDFYLCYTIIVQGAKNIINACRECKLRRLIYNSTVDVVFDGSRAIVNGDESLPYPGKFDHILSDLKAQAEALILLANNIDGLLTSAIRPCNVFGPGDTNLVPFFVTLARSGLTKFIIGSGENMSDFTYVENVSHAHICAEAALDFRMASVAGKAFFISNLHPIKFWDFLSLILEGLGYQRPLVKLPARMVWHILSFIKWAHRKWGFLECSHALFHYAQLASRSRTFNCSAAQKHIGYSPLVSHEEGVSLTIQSFSHLAKDMFYSRYCDRDEPSKVEKLLGGGKVADILLWRDEKKSFTCFLALVLLFNWFFLSGRTFADSAAKLLLLLTFFLFGYGVLPTKVFGFDVKRLPLSCFEIHEGVVKDSITAVARLWNRGFYCVRSLAKGHHWKLFFKVVASGYFLKLISLHSSMMAMGIALAFAFTTFFVYEQYESEVDGVAKFLHGGVKEIGKLLKTNLPHSGASILCKNNNPPQYKKSAPAQHWK
ncbi:3beta-hydroxysteroid-dehydrogenase/decarboxylase [Humulus lupulus]|uniref:3beta-hydroxysteroid- dehydrogenase/decarboxylase n=1 Tax=Humulus lupulus TaxID=3486 RepID=UPI002B40D501|nr:3beta-hydroxysteroid-dehydrogenase/decarboxylase [Humulus lupulus]